MPWKQFRPYLQVFTTTSAEMVSAQIGRVTLTFRNIGANDVYISSTPGVTNAAGANPGFPIKAGETLQMRKIDGDDTECAYYGIADTGATNVMVIR